MADLHIRSYSPCEYTRLASLWHACFPTDSVDYATAFLSRVPSETVALVGESDGEAVTMLLLLPASAQFRDETYTVRYLYAGCTHPAARGRGYYRRLMAVAEQLVRERGEAAIYLHPADAALTETYRRLGYLDGICRGVSTDGVRRLVPCADIDSYKAARIAAIESAKQRCVVWDMAPLVLEIFLQDAVADGAALWRGESTVVIQDGERMYDGISPSTARDDTTFCLWLPTGNITELFQYMQKYGGLTGMVGD